MITEQLKTEAKKEAAKLREFATVKERQKLDFSNLDPHAQGLCIYGQMTGDCFSQRATDLLIQCAEPYSADLLPSTAPRRGFHQFGRDFSAIECLIVFENDAVNASLIAYLRGETDEFNF